MAGKTAAPSIESTSFNCPHCGTLTSQAWFSVRAIREKDNGTPSRWPDDLLEDIQANEDLKDELKTSLLDHAEKIRSGVVFFDSGYAGDTYSKLFVGNLNVTSCYTCKKLSIWIGDRVVYPPLRHGVEPNEDLPDDVLRDYEEARSILDLSPRGAAAMLRLAIQKLCVELDEPGKHIDTDIANLVKKGLDPRVQKALDIVRVVGNESVHPGQMDLRDDRDIAVELLRLVNLIAEIMISQPKHIDAMYQGLPESKRKAIEKRDTKE